MFLQKINKHVSPPVFWGANFCIALLICFTVFFGDVFVEQISVIERSFLKSFGWAYTLSIVFTAIILLKVLYQHSHVKIGGKDAVVEFSNTAWVSMLFSAGLGIGLLYSGTYEPLAYYFNAPQIQHLAETPKFIESLHISYFHWGIPAWVLYSATGLMMAFAGFGVEKDFSFSYYSPFKSKIMDHFINIVAILCVLLGVIIAFAMGVQQINAGINLIFPAFPIGKISQVGIVAVITLVATLSVLSGLKKGIKFLSLLNIGLASSILLLVFLYIDKSSFMNVLIQALGYHISHFVEALTYTAALESKEWISSWTMLYWAWWASWTPFVGMFMARISRGRTIREFFCGTILVPSFICIIWLTVFAVFEFDSVQNGVIDFESLVSDAPYKSLFAILETTAIPLIASIVALFCIVIFYVTSSDSGSFVVDMIASGGKESPHSGLRIYWSVLEGVLALVLIFYGGVGFIKSLVVLTSLPVLLYICYGFYSLSNLLKDK